MTVRFQVICENKIQNDNYISQVQNNYNNINSKITSNFNFIGNRFEITRVVARNINPNKPG